MFIIKNISRHDLALGDLRVALVSGQKQDLDMICARYVSEGSKSLKIALKRGMVKVLRKDNPSVPPVMVGVKTVIEKDGNEEVMREIREMKKELIERQQAMAKQHIAALQDKTGGLDTEAMGQLQQAIQALQGIAGSTVAVPAVDNEFTISDDKAIDIQKRTVDRLTKNARGKIEHNETRSKTNVDSNVSELENLLGDEE